MSKIKKILLSAMLLALTIILARFLSVNTQFLVINFSFIPIILTAIWIGPKYCVLVAGLADLIGAILFPFGQYFPGFTISAVINGLIYGLILHDKKGEMRDKEMLIRLIISNSIVLLGVGIFLTSLWLNILYGESYIVLLTGRVLAQIIKLPIQVAVMYGLFKSLKPLIKEYFYE